MIWNLPSKIKNIFLGLIFPVECLGCGREGAYLCAQCLASIPLVDYFVCPVCQRPSKNGLTCESCLNKSHINGLTFATDYQNPLVRKSIVTLKYNLVKDLTQPLASLMITVLKNSNFEQVIKPDLVISVPLHPKRLADRGFNQSDILAKIICQEFGWNFNPAVLKRIRATKSQTDLTGQARWENVKNIFRVTTPKIIKNKNIILVDDVYTTGATLEEAAKTLKKYGAKTVWAITLAKD